MIQEFIHCKKCISKLEKYGNLPLDVYLGICEQYAQKNSIFCEAGKKGSGNTIINFLESKGFVVTTECYDDSLAVKPNGYREYETQYDIQTHEFCAFREIH